MRTARTLKKAVRIIGIMFLSIVGAVILIYLISIFISSADGAIIGIKF